MGKISDLIKGIATGGEKRFNSAVVLASGSGKKIRRRHGEAVCSP